MEHGTVKISVKSNASTNKIRRASEKTKRHNKMKTKQHSSKKKKKSVCIFFHFSVAQSLLKLVLNY